MKELKIVKIKCPRCGKTNLLPVFRRLKISEPLKCQFCGQLLARPEN